MQEKQRSHELKRVISWKEGLFIATGVPVLVLPSLGEFGMAVGGFAVLIWILSVTQGFLQCTAYAELATIFSNKAGLPGFVFEAFKKRNKFLPALGAWGYWFAWNPVLAITALLLGDYLHGMFFPHIPAFTLSLIFGISMFVLLLFVNYFGLAAGAYAQLALAILSLLPLLVLSISPFLMNLVDYSNFTHSFLPPTWDWGSHHSWLTILGLMALAQWSACAWETAAVYASEYKDPGRDTPKALFAAGGLCLLVFPLAQAAAIGTLGVEGLTANPYSPFVPIAQMVLGPVGGAVAIIMLIASLILVANTALLGSSRALYTMAHDGLLPPLFGRVNKNGIPFLAAVFTVLFNTLLIWLETPILVLAASAIGYALINGLTLFGFVLARIDHSDLPRAFQAPKKWIYVALFFALLNIPLYLIGNAYFNGVIPVLVGFLILLSFLPLYYYRKVRYGENWDFLNKRQNI